MTHVIFAFIVSLMAVGHAAPPLENVAQLIPKLNSQRIESFFGSYGIEKIDCTDSVFPDSRISNLYSIEGAHKVMRTLAIVDFNPSMDPDLLSVHEEVLNGKSIGIALQQAGWTIEKAPLYFGSTPLSSQVMEWMKESESNQSAVHIYQLNVHRGHGILLPYCTIIEVHSPQYLNEEWLQALYPEQYRTYTHESEGVKRLLNQLQTLIENFPGIL